VELAHLDWKGHVLCVANVFCRIARHFSLRSSSILIHVSALLVPPRLYFLGSFCALFERHRLQILLVILVILLVVAAAATAPGAAAATAPGAAAAANAATARAAATAATAPGAAAGGTHPPLLLRAW
tara:strand:+ start:924 stop:1304 length:381 start_codon:yes stop_codon:yes gene_type:complete